MQGMAKAILISIIVTVCMMLFTNLIFFFPWYMTLVVETFNISQVAASDNYIKYSYYDDAIKRLQNRPIYRDKADQIEVIAKNASGYSAIGEALEPDYETIADDLKPYRQRGNPVTVEVSAVYPLNISLWGKKYEKEIPVSFSLTTIGLKHYKDWAYYYD